MGSWWDRDGMEGPNLAGAGMEEPPLDLEGRQANMEESKELTMINQ